MAWVYDQLDGFQSQVEDSFRMIILIVIIDDFLHMVFRFLFVRMCGDPDHVGVSSETDT